MNATGPHPAARFAGLIVLTPLLAACLGASPLPSPVADSAAAQPTVPAGVLVSRTSRPQPSPARASASGAAHPSTKGNVALKPTPKPTARAVLEVAPYFLLEDPLNKSAAKLVPVARITAKTSAVARAALAELLAGAEFDREQGIRTEIPKDTRLLGLTIADGTATVNLSQEFESGYWGPSKGGRLAQVVYTLTRFSTVQRVVVHVNGKPTEEFRGQGLEGDRPLTRDDFMDYLPSIFVDSPAFGAYTGSLDGLRVRGKANVFEAQFQLVVVYGDSGDVAARIPVHASCGTGCWGDFDVRLPLKLQQDQTLQIQVYNLSAKDGSAEDIREYWAQAGAAPTSIDPMDGYGCGC
jgi:sporulation and spore germination protein/immunoglobulin-like protein involved in spore germination